VVDTQELRAPQYFDYRRADLDGVFGASACRHPALNGDGAWCCVDPVYCTSTIENNGKTMRIKGIVTQGQPASGRWVAGFVVEIGVNNVVNVIWGNSDEDGLAIRPMTLV
jgi:hypothetical protein